MNRSLDFTVCVRKCGTTCWRKLTKEEDEKIIAEYEEENTKLKERNDSLNNRDINLCRIANGIRDENFSLKELLKECKEVIKNVDTYYGNYDSTNGYLVITKIDEVLR